VSDPMTGMARAICPYRATVDCCGGACSGLAGAAWAYALSRLREPSPAREQARLAAWRDTRPYKRTSDWLASVVEADLMAFAREHGLGMPLGAPPGAQGGRSSDGTMCATSESETPSETPQNQAGGDDRGTLSRGGALPAHRTPGGHAA
jgi:hypothetical protein